MSRPTRFRGALAAALALLGALLLAAPLAAASEPNGAYRPGEVLGPEPSLSGPAGVAVDGSDRFYVADGGNATVRVFAAGGAYLRSFGSGGAEPISIPAPLAVALAPDGDAYVGTGEAEAIRVVRFDPEGEAISSWSLPGGALSLPRGIAATEAAVFVADAPFGQVHRYDRAGSLEATYGEETPLHLQGPDAPLGTLADPAGMALGPDGNLYVADAGNRRVQMLSPEGAFLRTWPLPPGSPPLSVAVGPAGEVAVGASGALAGCILRFGSAGEYRGQACEPGTDPVPGLAIGSDRTLLASQLGGEAGSGRARLFAWAPSLTLLSDLLTDYAGNRLEVADPPPVTGGF